MKKVLLASVAALAVFSAAAPVFAQGENPASSNQLIQKKYVSERDIADQAYAYVEAHPEDIAAAVEKEPSVIGYFLNKIIWQRVFLEELFDLL